MLHLPLTFLQRPAAATTPRPWLLVLMHGVGSNEQDLFSLAPQIPDRFHVLSLRAPFRMGPGSHAWFDFSIEPNGERTINEAQEAQSRALAAQAMGRGEPVGAMFSSLLFGLAQALRTKVSGLQGVSSHLVSVIPYVVTILGLVIYAASVMRRTRKHRAKQEVQK